MTAISEEDPNLSLRIKIEVNTRETSPAEPVVTRQFRVISSWFAGTASVLTFTDAEMMSTKIRALYQRKKGRDLFDLWLGLTQLGLTGEQLLAVFGPYRPSGLTADLAIANLKEKLNDDAFRSDLTPLIGELPTVYDIDGAAELVIAEVLAKL